MLFIMFICFWLCYCWLLHEKYVPANVNIYIIYDIYNIYTLDDVNIPLSELVKHAVVYSAQSLAQYDE